MILTLWIAMFFPQPTSAERAEIGRMIIRLGADRFAVREDASRKLTAFGSKARPKLAQAIAATKDEEVRARAAAVEAKIIESQLDSLRPLCQIDSNWYCTTQKGYVLDRAPFVEQERLLHEAPNDGSRHWAQYYAATEIWTRQQLRNGTPVAILRIRFAELHRRDGVWLRTLSGGPYDDYIVDHEAYLKGK